MLETDSPMSLESLERLVAAVALTEQDTVLDIGCGRGVLLKLLHEAYGCGGIGIDTSAERLDQARTLLSGIGSIELLDQDVTTFEPMRRFSLVSCLAARGRSRPKGASCPGEEKARARDGCGVLHRAIGEALQ